MTHRIHGAGIYANIGGIFMGSMLPYIAPWILWVMDLPKEEVFRPDSTTIDSSPSLLREIWIHGWKLCRESTATVATLERKSWSPWWNYTQKYGWNHGRIRTHCQHHGNWNNCGLTTGWWLTYPSEKYERQWEGWHPIYDMENKKCLKPPTSHGLIILMIVRLPLHMTCWALEHSSETCRPRKYLPILEPSDKTVYIKQSPFWCSVPGT